MLDVYVDPSPVLLQSNTSGAIAIWPARGHTVGTIHARVKDGDTWSTAEFTLKRSNFADPGTFTDLSSPQTLTASLPMSDPIDLTEGLYFAAVVSTVEGSDNEVEFVACFKGPAK